MGGRFNAASRRQEVRGPAAVLGALGATGLAPVAASTLIVRDKARGDETRDALGLTGVERDQRMLALMAFCEIVMETLPQAIIQSYVGVSYGQYTTADPGFSLLMVMSLAIGFLSSSSAIVAYQGTCGTEPAPLLGTRGMCCVCGIMGQIGSIVFTYALLGCAHKGLPSGADGTWGLEAVVTFGIAMYAIGVWQVEPIVRTAHAEDGPLKPMFLNLLIPLMICALFVQSFASAHHVDNNYADRTQDTWRYTYTNSSTDAAEAIRISPERMMQYAALHYQVEWPAQNVPMSIPLRHEDFSLWPELYTGGTIEVDVVGRTYRGIVVEPLPANGTWSTPFSYDCHERTSGLYPTYLFLVMSVVGMIGSILLDPRCGVTVEISARREALRLKLATRQSELDGTGKVNRKSKSVLYVHADDGREFYGISTWMSNSVDNNIKWSWCSLEVPEEGVRAVRGAVGGTFELGYAKARGDQAGSESDESCELAQNPVAVFETEDKPGKAAS